MEMLPPDRSINQHNYDPSVYDGVAEMYASGMSTPKIARAKGMQNSRIWKFLRRIGVRCRTKKDFSEIVALKNSGLHMAEICRRLNLPLHKVQHALRSSGIKTSDRARIVGPESRPEIAGKIACRLAANQAIANGTLVREICESCGQKAEAHHDNYNKPLEVRWLCFKHHREWHKTNNPIPFEAT